MRKSNCYFSRIGYILGLHLFCLTTTQAQNQNTYAYNSRRSVIQQENSQGFPVKSNETIPRQSLSASSQGLHVLNIEKAASIISGKVTTSDGSPAARVTVFIKGTKNGTSTNNEGFFSIDAKKGDILVFSFVGFQTKEVIVGDESTINVVLTFSNQELNTVVVTALGIKKQARAVGYSTTQIDGS
ncbi:MAG TPA: carboxypeptidase-like regulatory domain-containing protein, partial [Nitrosopumilaceae archaeon]|nr:carboxypeptidase-like regulatory domain-containing protein [Nitrosopumilaceae archaeon]